MGDIRLDTAFVVLLVTTLILFTVYYVLVSLETEEKDYGGLKEITGKVQSFEVSHLEANFYQPTKRVSERYDDKYFDYLWNRYELSVKSKKEKHEEEKCEQKLSRPDFIQSGDSVTIAIKLCKNIVPEAGFEPTTLIHAQYN